MSVSDYQSLACNHDRIVRSPSFAGKSTLNYAITGWDVFPINFIRETRCPFRADIVRVDIAKVHAGDVRVLVGTEQLLVTDNEDRYGGRWLSMQQALARAKAHNQAINNTPDGFAKEPLYIRVESPDVSYTVLQIDTPGFVRPEAAGSTAERDRARAGMQLLDDILRDTFEKPHSHTLVLSDLPAEMTAAAGDFYSERVVSLLSRRAPGGDSRDATVMRVYTKDLGFERVVTPKDAVQGRRPRRPPKH